MIGIYVLLLAPGGERESIVKPGSAGRGDASGDPFLTHEFDRRTGGNASSRQALGPDGKPLDTAVAGTKPAAADGEETPAGTVIDDAPVSFDPEEVNERIPGHLIIRVVDQVDDRPLSGTSVYFPLRGSKLTAEGGDVIVEGGMTSLAKRTNRHGVTIWSHEELAALLEDQRATGKEPTSVLVTAVGYADLFEPLAIPDLRQGAEAMFKLYPAVRVSGKVREKRGGAIGYAAVEILQTTQQGDAATPANRFSIKADALGEFTLKLAENYLYTFEVREAGFAPYKSRVFNFREDKREVSILLEFGRGVSGIVVDKSGKPIEGAEVYSRDDGETTKTDADGKFTFDMVRDRIYRNDMNLRASADGFAPVEKQVLANDHEIRIELPKEGTLHGVVVNAQNEPIAGAIVDCIFLVGNARYPYEAVATDAEGKFVFGRFGDGRVMLTATHAGLFSEATADVKAGGNVGPITMKLATAATITGVISANGEGISGVTLALDGKATGSSGPDGSFTLPGVKPGKHKLKIVNEYPIADDQIRQLPVFTTDGVNYYYLPKEQNVDLKLGESKTVNFNVEPFNADVDRKITVMVSTNPNEAATGVQVTIKPVFGAPPAGVEAPKLQVVSLNLPDGKAELSLSLLHGVSYEATFDHLRFFQAKLTPDSLAGVQDGGVIEVVLERAFVIKGYVQDSAGAGIESVGLSKDANNPWNMQASTDIYGYFEFGQLAAGAYTITAFKNSYYQERVQLTIEDTDPEPLQMTLVSANEIRIIVSNSGQPQPGAHVHIYRNDAEGDNPDDFKRHFDIGTTDAKGEKYINFHWARNYQIVAYYGNEVAFVNFNNLKTEPEREFTIELEPAYDLTGRVVDSDTGQPLGGVIVRAHIASTGVDGRDGNFFQMQTNSGGNFSFKVPAGDYYFYVPRTSSHQSFNTEGSNVPAGSTNLQLSVLLRDDIKGNYAQITSISAPPNMIAGETYTVDVTVKNVGDTTWVSNGNRPWRLGSQAPQDNKTWGMSRVNIGEGQDVKPKQTYIFSFTVTAPATAGNYEMQWRMVQDGREWFGQFSEKITINVTAPNGG